MVGNTFSFAFSQSDLFGKLIFVALFILSIASWVIIIHKICHLWAVRRASQAVERQLASQLEDPLSLKFSPTAGRFANPFWKVFACIKQNYHHLKQKDVIHEQLTRLIQARVEGVVAEQGHLLDRNLFVLTLTVTLAPFLGLLGTVWGILITFSNLQGSRSQQLVLGGLSMALATTVLGLVVAIPALVGHATMRSFARDAKRRIERFAALMQRTLEVACEQRAEP